MREVTELTGGCACGGVRFKATGRIAGGAVCYCNVCQKIGAGGPNYTMSMTHAEIETTGNTQVFRNPGGTGEVIERIYCQDCGVHLYAQGGGNSHLLRIKAGGLDDPTLYQPTLQCWTSQAKPWHVLNPALPAFPKNPTGSAGEK